MDLKARDPETAAAIEALEWVADGIRRRHFEQEAVRYLVGIADFGSGALLRALLATPWLQDALTRDEYLVLGGLRYLAQDDEAAAVKVHGMPFLEEIDYLDWRALSSLGYALEEGRLEEILSQPSLRDGITDEQTNVIAVLYEVMSSRPDLLTTLFDARQTVVEERLVSLPLKGNVDLSVIWPGSGASTAKASHTMDLLEDTIRTFEEFKGVAYPRPYAMVLVADVTEAGGGGGDSFVTIDPPYYDNSGLMAHEVAHTYWPFAPSWIAEGGASFMDKVYASASTGTPLPQPRSCPQVANLSELVKFQSWQDSEVFGCNYSLGEGLFLDLYHTLGDTTFRQAFGTLYTFLDDEALYVRCITAPKGLCYVHAAFIEGLPDQAAITEKVINRHYYGNQQ